MAKTAVKKKTTKKKVSVKAPSKRKPKIKPIKKVVITINASAFGKGVELFSTNLYIDLQTNHISNMCGMLNIGENLKVSDKIPLIKLFKNDKIIGTVEYKR